MSEVCGTGPGRDLARQPRAADPHLARADLAVLIPPTPNQGRATPGDALAHQIATTSRERVSPTRSRSDGPELAAIRRLIGIAVGLG
ncbi:MAG: hypothetical protein WBJ41_00185 [Chromatiaceae bacterium]